MILNTYDEVVRHFNHFTDYKLWLHSVDGDSVDRITNVQFNSSHGLMVKINGNNEWLKTNNKTIFNNLTEEQFRVKKQLVKQKKGRIKTSGLAPIEI